MAENPEDLIVTDAELRRQLPVLAEELKIGGSGSGIEEVSGTVTLDATGPAIREVYATAAATVQGEPLEAGSAALFRRFSGAWQVRVMNPDGSVKDAVWRAPATTPTPPVTPPPTGSPTAVALTPEDVVFKDTEGSANDTFTLAARTGVAWSVSLNGGAASTMPAGTHTVSPAGATVKITATPASSAYVLTGQTVWSNTFDTSAPIVWANTVLRDTFTRADQAISGSKADTGQTWVGSVYYGQIVGNTFRPSPANNHHYLPAVTGDQSMRAKVTLPSGRFATVALLGGATDNSGTGVQVQLDDRGDGTGRVVLSPAPATMNYNQEGRKESNGTVSGWSHVAGYSTGQPRILRCDMVGSTATVFVDGVKILEGTYSSAQMATLTGANLHVWSSGANTAVVDDLEVLTP